MDEPVSLLTGCLRAGGGGVQLRKQAVLQVRQRGTVVCQALVPLLLLLLGGLFQLIANALIPSGETYTVIPPALPLKWPFFVTYVWHRRSARPRGWVLVGVSSLSLQIGGGARWPVHCGAVSLCLTSFVRRSNV